MEEHNTIKLIGKKDFLTAKKRTQQLLPNKPFFPKSYRFFEERISKLTRSMLKSKSLNVSICPNPYIHVIQEGKTHVLHVILLPTEIVFFFSARQGW